MVSSATPPRREEYRTGVVGIALAVENEAGELVRTLVRKVLLASDRELESTWVARYAGDIEGSTEGVLAAQAAGEAMAVLDGVTQVAAHFVVFHRSQLKTLITDGGGAVDGSFAELDWFDTMHKATIACKIPGRHSNAFKPPSLPEASEILTGTPIPASMAGLPWREALLTNLSAVRRVWRVLNGREVPAGLIEELPEQPASMP